MSKSISPNTVGPTQRLVLHLLALGQKTIRTLAMDHPGLGESQASGAVSRLASRGLVDRVRRDGAYAYVYALTQSGRALEAELLDDWVDEDGES